MLSKTKTIEAVQTMGDLFPDAHCELNHRNAFELLIATILSAQATDVGVIKLLLNYLRDFQLLLI